MPGSGSSTTLIGIVVAILVVTFIVYLIRNNASPKGLQSCDTTSDCKRGYTCRDAKCHSRAENCDADVLLRKVDGTFSQNATQALMNKQYRTAYWSQIDSEGRLYVLNTDDNIVQTISRHNLDGTLDLTFAQNGIATLPTNQVISFLVASDGSIVVIQNNTSTGADQIYKLDSNGQFDTTFNPINLRFSIVLSGNQACLDDEGGWIYLFYYDTDPFMSLRRYNLKNGTLDTHFGGGDGSVGSFNWGDTPGNQAMTISKGLIYVANYRSSNPSNTTVYRFDKDGELDTTFGVSGSVTMGIPLVNDYDVAGIVVGDDGNVYLGLCNVGFPVGNGIVVFKLTPDGIIDTTYGSAGMAFAITENIQSHLFQVAIMCDERVVMTGFTSGPGAANSSVALVSQTGEVNYHVFGDVKRFNTFQSMAIDRLSGDLYCVGDETIGDVPNVKITKISAK